jgi:DICT domain-containing protein
VEPVDGGGLTIGAVAARTAVSVPVLRAWEVRYGFPHPARSASGHRRYSDRDVELILRVVREREAGLSLEAAIDRARRVDAEPLPSIFAGVRRDRPDLVVHSLTRRTMQAISHAIEDEYMAQAERPVLLAAFQSDKNFRVAETRWRDLTRTSAGAVAFGGFDAVRLPDGGPAEVPVADDAPLHREWAVVCDAPGAAACLSGWELPGQDAVLRADRRFEAVWSVEPTVVRRATLLGLALARRHAPELESYLDRLADELSTGPDAPAAAVETVRRATALTNRVVAYMDRGRRPA